MAHAESHNRCMSANTHNCSVTSVWHTHSLCPCPLWGERKPENHKRGEEEEEEEEGRVNPTLRERGLDSRLMLNGTC